MTYTYNGKTGPKNASHPIEPADHHFHGALNPARDNYYISYSDHYTFHVQVDGDTGSADLHIYGNYTLLPASACSHGVCP